METIIITPATYGQHADALEAYHRLRHDIFVSLAGLGRSDLYAAAGQETDIWDLPHFNPAHFVVMDRGQAVAVGRMTSAQRPTMMEVLYSHFCDKPVERDPDLWEVQRVGIDLARLQGVDRERAFLTLFTAMERFALDQGISRLMLLTFLGIWKKRLTDMRRMGPVSEHIGFPHVALISELIPEKYSERCALLEQLNKVSEGEERAA